MRKIISLVVNGENLSPPYCGSGGGGGGGGNSRCNAHSPPLPPGDWESDCGYHVGTCLFALELILMDGGRSVGWLSRFVEVGRVVSITTHSTTEGILDIV